MRKRKPQTFHSLFASTWDKLQKAWKPKTQRVAQPLRMSDLVRDYDAMLRQREDYYNMMQRPTYYGNGQDGTTFLGASATRIILDEYANDHEDKPKPEINKLYNFYKK